LDSWWFWQAPDGRIILWWVSASRDPEDPEYEQNSTRYTDLAIDTGSQKLSEPITKT
jgi:hypothetical protein